jgi:hypothetical protein
MSPGDPDLEVRDLEAMIPADANLLPRRVIIATDLT